MQLRFRRCLISGFLARSGGNVAILTSFILPVAILFCGLIIDKASVHIDQRKLQNAVDMAAISAASDINSADRLAQAVLTDNGFRPASRIENPDPDLPDLETSATTSRVEKGRYTADVNIPVSQRFQAGALPYNAVRVTAEHTGRYPFNPLNKADPVYSRSAVATLTPQVAYSIGSRLASIDEGLANQLLGELTGSEISLVLMDYRALASAEVSALGFLDSLATTANLTAVTYNDVIDASVTLNQVATALSTMTNGDTSTSLQRFSASVLNSTHKIPLRNIINPGPAGNLRLGEGSSRFATSLGVMELIGASAIFANGESQIDLDLSASVPEFVSATLAIVIGEPSQHSGWFRIGSNGDILHTAQTRLKLIANIGAGDLEEDAIISLPLYAELAYAEAAVSDASCAYNQPLSKSATILARPGVVRMWIGEEEDATFSNFGKTIQPAHATLVNLELVRVKAKAATEMSNQNSTRLSFSAAEISNGTTKTVSTSQFSGVLTSSLLDSLDLKVETLGLGLSLPGGVGTKLADLLETKTAALDTILSTTLETLGIGLGEADVRVHAVQCSLASLVH